MKVSPLRTLPPSVLGDGSIAWPALGACTSERVRAPRLFEWIREYVECDHATVFEQRDGMPPSCLFSASAPGESQHAHAASAYCRVHYRADTMLNAVLPQASRTPHLLQYAVSDAPNSAYRSDCYEAPGFGERIAVYTPVDGGWRWFNLYRRSGRQSFDGGALVNTAMQARAVMAAVRTSPDGRTDHPGLHDLSDRERLVLLLQLRGDSAKEVARGLGVAPSTVVTYRQRAYVKLGVQNHRELVAKLLREAGWPTPAMP